MNRLIRSSEVRRILEVVSPCDVAEFLNSMKHLGILGNPTSGYVFTASSALRCGAHHWCLRPHPQQVMCTVCVTLTPTLTLTSRKAFFASDINMDVGARKRREEQKTNSKSSVFLSTKVLSKMCRTHDIVRHLKSHIEKQTEGDGPFSRMNSNSIAALVLVNFETHFKSFIFIKNIETTVKKLRKDLDYPEYHNISEFSAATQGASLDLPDKAIFLNRSVVLYTPEHKQLL